jgi:hypothetical protein
MGMTTEDLASHPKTVTLSDLEQEAIMGLIMSGGADEATFTDEGVLARVSTTVVLESEGSLHCERWPSYEQAQARYEALLPRLEG